MTIATDLGKVVNHLQLERGEVAFWVFTNGSTLRTNLTNRFESTDQAINNMTTWEEITVSASANSGEVMLNKSDFTMRLNTFRNQTSYEENTALEVMFWYMSVNNALLEKISNQIKESDKSGIWR